MQFTVHCYREDKVGATSSHPQSIEDRHECMHSSLCLALLYSLGMNHSLEDVPLTVGCIFHINEVN